MYCLETKDLSHRFSKDQLVLSAINLKVEEGCIYGFLGPNGAGKTTTLKLILGLLKKQSGEIKVFGQNFSDNRIQSLSKIGSLIESPSLYGQLTALENLEVLRKIYNCPGQRITEVLNLVGLAGTKNKKAGEFSLGMKQRLSIAIALLHNPSLLVLDEPTNGLDPNGIIEMRELLKKLNTEEAITIIISSHLLTEIEKLVTHLGVIHKGELLFQGKLAELMERQMKSSRVIFETTNNLSALQLIGEMYPSVTLESGKIILPEITFDKIAALNRKLIVEGIDVYQVTTLKSDLESVFMELTTTRINK